MADIEAITVDEAVAILHSTRTYVFTLVHKGKLTYKKQGKRWLLRRDEVEALAASGWHTVGVLEAHKSKVAQIK